MNQPTFSAPNCIRCSGTSFGSHHINVNNVVHAMLVYCTKCGGVVGVVGTPSQTQHKIDRVK